MSNTLDKPLDSRFGFVSVLPAAFFVYHSHASQDNATDKLAPAERWIWSDSTQR